MCELSALSTPLPCHLFMDKDEASCEAALSQSAFSLPLT